MPLPSPADFGAALLAPDVAPPLGLTPAGRFAVYRNNVMSSLIEALAAAYPAVRSLVGERFFQAAAIVHVRAEPPTSPVLLHYGAGFPAFIESFAPASRLPYLGDVARLERAWLEAYHAAESAPLPLQVLRQIAGEATADARLTLHPSTRLIVSRFPIVSLWAANTGRSSHDAVDLSRPETALVVRPAADVQVYPIDQGFATLLGCLLRRRTLADAAGAALAAMPAFDFAKALQHLFTRGVVIAITPSELRRPVP